MILRSRPTLRSGILLFTLWFILIVLGIVWHIDYRKYVSACTEQTAGIVTNIYVNESKRGRSGRTEIGETFGKEKLVRGREKRDRSSEIQDRAVSRGIE